MGISGKFSADNANVAFRVSFVNCLKLTWARKA